MGLRLGYQKPHGFDLASHALPGEDGYFMNLRPRPTREYPLRAIVRTPCASFVGTTPEDARAWLDHPGDMPNLAAHYIEWAEQEMNR